MSAFEPKICFVENPALREDSERLFLASASQAFDKFISSEQLVRTHQATDMARAPMVPMQWLGVF
jgi:hypothetical protein